MDLLLDRREAPYLKPKPQPKPIITQARAITTRLQPTENTNQQQFEN